MKIKRGFTLRNICDENIIVSEGKENIDFTKIISMNETSAYLWKKIKDVEFDAEKLATLLCEEYDVDYQVALSDSNNLIKNWQEAGIAE